MCKWLFEVGAVEDITKADTNGETPMWIACYGGHLSVCTWLFEVGAAADIIKADDEGLTPMLIACAHDNMSVCQWLILKGALAIIPDDASRRSFGVIYLATRRLLEWAVERVEATAELRRTVLVGALSPRKSAHLWRLGSLDDATNLHFKQLVADFLGLLHGQELRNVNMAVEVLTRVMDSADGSTDDEVDDEEDGHGGVVAEDWADDDYHH